MESLADEHLSRIVYDKELESHSSECFPKERLFAIHPDPSHAEIMNHLVYTKVPESWAKNNRD